MKRSPMKPRKAPLRASGRIAPSARTASEFARIYGSKARVLWVQSLPCVGCGAMPSVNAHTVTGGTGRKADASTIAPLCHACHVAYDRHRAPFHDEERRGLVKLHAVITDATWERMGNPEPLSSVVPRVVAALTNGAGE